MNVFRIFKKYLTFSSSSRWRRRTPIAITIWKRKVMIKDRNQSALVSRISSWQGTLIGRALVIRCSATGKVELVSSDRDSSGSRLCPWKISPVLPTLAIPNPLFHLSKQCAEAGHRHLPAGRFRRSGRSTTAETGRSWTKIKYKNARQST